MLCAVVVDIVCRGGVAAADVFVQDLAGGIEDFAFDVFVVGREGGLRFFTEGSRGCRREVGCCAQDNRTEREVVKHFAAIAPNICAAVFPNTFIVEAIDCGYLP